MIISKGFALVFVLILLIIPTIAFVQPIKCSGDVWVQRASIPAEMYVYGLAAVNSQVYAFGVDANQKAYTYAYNPATDAWSKKAPMPTSRQWFTIVTYQDNVYAIGGVLGVNSTTGAEILTGANEMYNPLSDNWTIKASMPTPRTSMQGNLVNGKIYVVSGLVGNIPGPSLTNVNEVYSPSTDTWVTAAPIPTPVFGYASVSVDNKIYVIGGTTENGFTDANQIFDTATNSWSLGKALPTLTVQAVGVAATGDNSLPRVYVIGGRLNGPVDSTQIYNVSNDEWIFGAPFPTTHDYITEYLAATALNDTLFIVGGIAHANEGFYELTEQYFPTDYNGTIPSPSPTTLTPSPSVPEFPWMLAILALFVAVSILFAVTVSRQLRQGSHKIRCSVTRFN